MAESVQMQGAPNESAAVQITLASGTTLLRLKSWLPAYIDGGKPVVFGGRELPSQVGATLGGPTRVLCVGPGEWLIVSHEFHPPYLLERTECDWPQEGLALVDLTDARACLEVRGAAVREMLSKGCGLDLHPRSFPVGRCARTRFAQIPW